MVAGRHLGTTIKASVAGHVAPSVMETAVSSTVECPRRPRPPVLPSSVTGGCRLPLCRVFTETAAFRRLSMIRVRGLPYNSWWAASGTAVLRIVSVIGDRSSPYCVIRDRSLPYHAIGDRSLGYHVIGDRSLL